MFPSCALSCQAVIDVLKFYTGQTKEKEDEKFLMTVNKQKGTKLHVCFMCIVMSVCVCACSCCEECGSFAH